MQLVKRIRKVKTLAYIIGYLKAQMPSLMGRDKKQQKLISDLPNVFRTVMKKYNLAPGDFPVSIFPPPSGLLRKLTHFSAGAGHQQFLRKAEGLEVLRVVSAFSETD